MRRRAWTYVAVGSVVYWGWVVLASALFGDDTPSAAYLPLVAGAALTIAAGLVGARDRRPDRVPLWLAALAGALELGGIVWSFVNDRRGSDGEAYAFLLVLALFVLPAAAVWGFSARRFARAPEAVRPPFGVRLARGWSEATRSWSVVWRHRALLPLPVASFTLGTTGWIGGYLLAGIWVEKTMTRIAVTGFVTLLPMTLIGTFLGVAYIAALNRRLDGAPATVTDGLHAAWHRRGAIAAWSLLAAGVGAVLQGLQQLKSEWALAPLLSWLAGVAWGLLTVFVLPVLALEDVGVRDAARRVGALVKRRWGEGMGGLANLGAVTVVAMLPFGFVFGVAAAVAAPDRAAITAVAAVGFVTFMLVVSAMGTATHALSVALYRYGRGRPVAPFDGDELQRALLPRRRWGH